MLQSVSGLLTRARELTLSASTDTLAPADRATIAAELNAIADEIEEQLKKQLGSRPVRT